LEEERKEQRQRRRKAVERLIRLETRFSDAAKRIDELEKKNTELIREIARLSFEVEAIKKQRSDINVSEFEAIEKTTTSETVIIQ
jgi:regulator of replication initiation timing